jgi:hypothetical protein
MKVETAVTTAISPTSFRRVDVLLARLLPYLVWTFSLGSQFFYLASTDATWLLTVGRRLLDGSQLYSAEIVEVNTPPIMYVMAGIVWIADRLGATPLNVWRFAVAGLIAGTVVLLARILDATLQSRAADLRLPILATVTTLLTCLPGDATGEREHLVVLCLLPYTFLSALRAGGATSPRHYAILAGALMGFAVWLKPHHVLAVLLVEVGVAFRRRTLAALATWELGVGMAVIIGYAGWIAWRIPQFYSSAVPLALQFYPSYGRLALRPVHFTYVIAAVVALVACRSPRIAVMMVSQAFLAGLGSFAAFVLQDKGWRYQALPHKTFLLMAAAIGLAAVFRAWFPYLEKRYGARVRPWARLGASLALLTPALLVVWTSVRADQAGRSLTRIRALERLLRAIQLQRAEPLRLMVLDEYPFPAFPLVTSVHAEWTSRFASMWMLPAILDAESRAVRPAPWMIDGRRYLTTSIVEDMIRRKPNVVIVKRTGPIDILTELSRDEGFRRLWAGFRATEIVNGYEFYQPLDGFTGSAARSQRQSRASDSTAALETPLAATVVAAAWR